MKIIIHFTSRITEKLVQEIGYIYIYLYYYIKEINYSFGIYIFLMSNIFKQNYFF